MVYIDRWRIIDVKDADFDSILADYLPPSPKLTPAASSHTIAAQKVRELSGWVILNRLLPLINRCHILYT